MEKFSSESIRFLPEVDLTDFKPYGESRHILEIQRLKPEHCLSLQRAMNKGSDHIAGYFAWAENAQLWNTKSALFWIQVQLKEQLPSEHFVFLLGKDLVGMGSLRPFGHPRHVQMAYWVAKGYLHQGIGESIARTIESMALNHRPYQYVYINHDSNNRASGAIPQRLGYQLLDTFNTEVSAKLESGFWFSWIKESSRYADCENERLRDLRYAILWCQMIKEMHPDIYMNEYAENHSLALKEYGIEQERVRTNNQNDVE